MRVCRTGNRFLYRWRIITPVEDGMDLERLYLTHLGARFSRWVWS